MTDSLEEEVTRTLKILVIGDVATGKSCLIQRYTKNAFSNNYKYTIGCDFMFKNIRWDAKTVFKLQLWDIAGQERFYNMTRVYYKDAVGCFVLFDLTRPSTLEAANKWKLDLDSKTDSRISCVLLGNKCDLVKENLEENEEHLNEFCEKRNFAGWFQTSAKDNVNIEEAINFLVTKILDKEMNEQKERDEQLSIKIQEEKNKKKNKKKCC